MKSKPSERTVTVISCSRHFDDAEFLAKHMPPPGPRHIVIHGAGTGGDLVIDKLCRKNKNRVIPVPAVWKADGNPGPDRNGAMAEIAKILMGQGYVGKGIAFPGPKSKGTWSAVNKMRKAGISPAIVKVPK